MGFTEISVVLFLAALLVFGFINSRKVSQELKKLETDK
jgi:preprotein translocase subunit SecG